jgi:hypothetical protein
MLRSDLILKDYIFIQISIYDMFKICDNLKKWLWTVIPDFKMNIKILDTTLNMTVSKWHTNITGYNYSSMITGK